MNGGIRIVGPQAGRQTWVRTMAYWGPVALYAGLIFYLSAQSHPEEDLPSFVDLFSDKVLHAVEYAGLGGFCYRAFRWGGSGRPASRAVLFAVVAASLYGITDEVHQLFVPFRESSWQDWVADTIGAVLGAAGGMHGASALGRIASRTEPGRSGRILRAGGVWLIG